jgi:hypothetical protein
MTVRVDVLTMVSSDGDLTCNVNGGIAGMIGTAAGISVFWGLGVGELELVPGDRGGVGLDDLAIVGETG